MRRPIVFRSQRLPIESLLRYQDSLALDPVYQRQGDVWSKDRQRLFLDSLLNEFIIPPMFWHVLSGESTVTAGGERYAVVDGKQRLQALFEFVENDLRLDADFEFLQDEDLDLASMTLSEIGAEHPWLYASFMRTTLEVIFVETNEIDLIEELFFRLNEGVPLSAAEKRNRGPILPNLVRNLADEHPFFQQTLPFGNKRYRHYDLIAKFMSIEDKGVDGGKVPNLRKDDLDRLFARFRPTQPQEGELDDLRAEAGVLLQAVSERLNQLQEIFEAKDRALSSVGMVTLYYSLDKVISAVEGPPLSKEEVDSFEMIRESVKDLEPDQMSDDQRRADEFGTYSQGPTSGLYLSRRLEIFLEVMRDGDPQNAPELADPE